LQPKLKATAQRKTQFVGLEKGSDTNLLSAGVVRRKAVAKSKR
jgi:hypothetical protein